MAPLNSLTIQIDQDFKIPSDLVQKTVATMALRLLFSILLVATNISDKVLFARFSKINHMLKFVYLQYSLQTSRIKYSLQTSRIGSNSFWLQTCT